MNKPLERQKYFLFENPREIISETISDPWEFYFPHGRGTAFGINYLCFGELFYGQYVIIELGTDVYHSYRKVFTGLIIAVLIEGNPMETTAIVMVTRPLRINIHSPMVVL
jgi:hypothetical protein